MPSTVSANNMTTVHAGSTGIAVAFPDVCKTPTPGGPIPIPYPNIAQSSDTADGSSTVKVDGNPIMLKGSNFKMSTGDEAGSAMGVVSNKIKGKAEPVNYSFDVKVDGKNVFRLGDMMLHNVGGPNTPTTPEGQAPNPGIPTEGKECEKTHAKRKEQQKNNTAWSDSGIVGEHRGKIQAVATKEKVVIYFRQTKKICGRWIIAKHQPKPHGCMDGTTIKPEDVPQVQRWLDEHFAKHPGEGSGAPAGQNQHYSKHAADYVGLVGIPEGDGLIRPEKGRGKQPGASYKGKWMTGDYDVFEVLANGDECKKVTDEDRFGVVQMKINKKLKWDAIQHPPQAQWVPNAQERAAGVAKFDMNKEVAKCLTGESRVTKKLKWHPARGPMSVIDKPLTVVAGNGVVTLKKKSEVKDALICQGCP